MKTIDFAMIGDYMGFVNVQGKYIVPIIEKRFITVTVSAEDSDTAMMKALNPSFADKITVNESIPGTVEVAESAKGMVEQKAIDFVNNNLDKIVLPTEMTLVPTSLEFDKVNPPE